MAMLSHTATAVRTWDDHKGQKNPHCLVATPQLQTNPNCMQNLAFHIFIGMV